MSLRCVADAARSVSLLNGHFSASGPKSKKKVKLLLCLSCTGLISHRLFELRHRTEGATLSYCTGRMSRSSGHKINAGLCSDRVVSHHTLPLETMRAAAMSMLRNSSSLCWHTIERCAKLDWRNRTASCSQVAICRCSNRMASLGLAVGKAAK